MFKQVLFKLQSLGLKLRFKVVFVTATQIFKAIVFLSGLILPSLALFIELTLKSLILIVKLVLKFASLFLKCLFSLLHDLFSDLVFLNGVLVCKLFADAADLSRGTFLCLSQFIFVFLNQALYGGLKFLDCALADLADLVSLPLFLADLLRG